MTIARGEEQLGVRRLAAELDAARLSLANALPPEVDPEPLVNRALLSLWEQRFRGLLSRPPAQLPQALKALGLKAPPDLQPLVGLLERPCRPALAEGLAKAHELLLCRRLVRRGPEATFIPSPRRRSGGVYYTPAFVVEFMVEETLGAWLRPWEASLAQASPEELRSLLERARALRVLDPACGGGAFLLGALRRLRAFYCALGERWGGSAPAALAAPGKMALESLCGVDLDEEALRLAALALLAEVQEEAGPAPQLVGQRLCRGDHLEPGLHQESFPEVFSRPDPGFEVIVGNPPYARQSPAQQALAQAGGYRSWRGGDLYPLFVEALTRLCARSGRGALIVPLSLGFSRAMRSLREEVILPSGRSWRLAHFDRIPSGLFEAEVRTRTIIALVGPLRPESETLLETGPLLRFSAAQRPRIFEGLEFFPATSLHHPQLGFPKLGSHLQARWLERLLASGHTLGAGLSREGAFPLYFKQNCYGFAIVSAELPPAFDGAGGPLPQTKYSTLSFARREERDVALALLAGVWLFWWWLLYGDGFDVTKQLVRAFPVDPQTLPPEVRASLAKLGQTIQRRVRQHVAYKKNGGKRIGTFDLRRCRALSEEADALVAKALGACELLGDVRAMLARTHGAG